MRRIIFFLGFMSTTIIMDAQVPSFAWVRQAGAAGDDEGLAITIDSAGNIYTTGIFSATVDFDPGVGEFNLTSAGQSDVFISKIDAAGNLVWAKSFGGSGADIANSIALDASGNIYTTGWFFDTSDFDPGAGVLKLASNGADDIFISKLDAAGNLVWARTMGSPLSDQGGTLSVDGSGNVYTIGSIKQTVDFDPGQAVYNLSSEGGYDCFILKLDSNGDFLWVKQIGGTGDDYSYTLAPNSAGDLYVLVSLKGILDLDPGPGIYKLTSKGGLDICMIKLDTGGNFEWAKNIGGTSNDEAFTFTIDNAGNFYFTGYFGSIVDFDPGPAVYNLTSKGNDDIFILKLDSAFNFVWARQMGGSLFDYGLALDIDAGGKVYATGFFSGTADFDPGSAVFNLTSHGDFDIHTIALDASGNFIWAAGFGNTSQDGGRGVAVHGSGSIYTVGYFQSEVDFNPGTGVFNLSSAGDYDIYLHKMTVGFPAALNENSKSTCTIYPNPGDDFFTIEFDETASVKNISIYDVSGRLVGKQAITGNVVALDLQHLSHGLYFLSYQSDGTVFNTKFVIN